jgi:dTDP-4-amino-4,6-dideoxygalactose transaminase
MTSSTPAVPHADPGAEYRAMKDGIDCAVHRVLASGRYILAEECAAFEQDFAHWLGVAYAVGFASGTDALILALRALGIGPGSAVVTVSHTAVAVVAAIELVGATPVLVDIESKYFTMDPAELAAVLDHPPIDWPPIRAVIPVHLYGQAADLDQILHVCAQHDLMVIEDCSQAHGATWHGQKVGTFGAMAAFSLYPTKNLGALGDAGVLVTGEPSLADRIGVIRQYGWRDRFHSDVVGMNSRLDELQAAILHAKLPYLDAMNQRRRAIAVAYDAALADGRFAPPARRPGAEHVFNQYVIRVPDRALLRSRLLEEGNRHRHPLSGANPSPTGLCRPLAARAIQLPVDGNRCRRDRGTTDLSGAHQRPGRPCLFRSSWLEPAMNRVFRFLFNPRQGVSTVSP